MRRIGMLASVLVTLAATGAGPAAATVPEDPVAGRVCGYFSLTDPRVDDGSVYVALVNGGPLAATRPGARVQLTCSIHVGAANLTHAGADACAVTSDETIQVTALGPTTCSYPAHEGEPEALCTQVIVDGTRWYRTTATRRPLEPVWHAVHGEHRALWSTDATSACTQAIRQDMFPDPFTRSVLEDVDRVFVTFVDPASCPALGALTPGVPGVVDIDPSGDVYILGEWWWDCRP